MRTVADFYRSLDDPVGNFVEVDEGNCFGVGDVATIKNYGFSFGRTESNRLVCGSVPPSPDVLTFGVDATLYFDDVAWFDVLGGDFD